MLSFPWYWTPCLLRRINLVDMKFIQILVHKLRNTGELSKLKNQMCSRYIAHLNVQGWMALYPLSASCSKRHCFDWPFCTYQLTLYVCVPTCRQWLFVWVIHCIWDGSIVLGNKFICSIIVLCILKVIKYVKCYQANTWYHYLEYIKHGLQFSFQ